MHLATQLEYFTQEECGAYLAISDAVLRIRIPLEVVCELCGNNWGVAFAQAHSP